MPQNEYSNVPYKIAHKERPDYAQRAINFAHEGMADEEKALKQFPKNPVAPVEAKARVQARMNASKAGAASMYDFPSKE